MPTFREPLHATTALPRAHRRSALACGVARGAACLALLAGLAMAQEPAPRAFAQRARELLTDPAPRVRGEAALVLAAARDPADHEALRRIAGEPQQESAQRALIALGILAAPGTSQLLLPLLPEPGGKFDDRAVVAAFALALLPDEQGSAELARVLVRTRQGSFRRQQPLLHALALGSSMRSGTMHAGALEQLLHDESLKDPQVRALLLQALARIEGMPADDDLGAALASAHGEERAAGMRILASRPSAPTWLEQAMRMQGRDPDPQVRALALALLTRARHPQALERAMSALRTEDRDEAAQAVRTLLQLGGGALRTAVESSIRSQPDAAHASAMLLAYRGPPSETMASWCREVALDARKPVELRAAAAMVARDAAGEDLRQVLATGLQDSTDPDVRNAAAAALCGAEVDLDLARLAPASALHAERSGRVLGALLATGHPQATAHALHLLQDAEAGTALRTAVLTAVRTALLPWLDASSGPQALRIALAD